MSTKKNKTIVKKIPLQYSPINRPIRFSQFDELYLNLLENPSRLKRNPPRPVFVYNPNQSQQPEYTTNTTQTFNNEASISSDDSDLDIDLLEKKYSDPSNTRNPKEDDGSIGEIIMSDVSNDDGSSNNSSSVDKLHNSTKTQPGSYLKFVDPNDEENDPEKDEQEEKDTLLIKFMNLKRSYKNLEIPEFTDLSDLETMKRSYAKIIRNVSLDSTVETYKKLLIVGFGIIEFVGTKFLGLNLQNLTKSQMQVLNQYDLLLLELGEKHYNPIGTSFPVEVRLMGMVLFNTAIFYMFGTSVGGTSNILNILTGMMGSGGFQSPQEETQQPKQPPKMRGPTISPEEIKRMNSYKQPLPMSPKHYSSDEQSL